MTHKNYKNLFEPVSFGSTNLKNRIVMAPMTRSRAIHSIPNDLMATYYSQRASAGLIITEGTAPSPNGLGYARIPGIYNAEQREGWKKVTDSVHAAGGKIFVQLMHTGRVAHGENMPAASHVLAPSAIAAAGNMWTDTKGMQPNATPRAMTALDITDAIQEFVVAAKNAIDAGFDGVELHAANGYLLEQFLNPNSNTRTDDYGGTKENRSRFVLEVSRAVVAAVGRDKVGVRLSPYGQFNDMPLYNDINQTYDYLAQRLNELGIVYIHLIDYAARNNEDGVALIKSIRQHFANTLIVNGGYTAEAAQNSLTNNVADLVSFGSPFIANPDLPLRLQNKFPLVKPNPATFYTPDEVGYTDYAFSDTEYSLIK